MSDEPRPSTPAAEPPPPPTAPAIEWGAGHVATPTPSRARTGLRAIPGAVRIIIALVVVAGAIAGFVTTRGGSSTDGTFSTGDCVTLTSSTVHLADCGSQHDGKITAVLHQSYQTCPSGSDEFDVTDNTGNLCIDRTQ